MEESPASVVKSTINIITAWLSEVEQKTKNKAELTHKRLEAEHRIAMSKLDKDLQVELKKAGLLDEQATI